MIIYSYLVCRAFTIGRWLSEKTEEKKTTMKKKKHHVWVEHKLSLESCVDSHRCQSSVQWVQHSATFLSGPDGVYLFLLHRNDLQQAHLTCFANFVNHHNLPLATHTSAKVRACLAGRHYNELPLKSSVFGDSMKMRKEKKITKWVERGIRQFAGGSQWIGS